MAAADEPRLALSIERLTYGADALARHDGGVVFVPLAAPGDRISAAVVESHRDWRRAEVRELITPGADRVPASCPAFGTCGGCQWQHVALDAQRATKAAIVSELLARVGGIREAELLPLRAAGNGWGYRARVTLIAEGRRLGFRRRRSHHLVEIADCAIADPVLVAHLDVAREWAAGLRAAPERVGLARAADGVVLTAMTGAPPPPRDLAATERLLVRHATVRGAVLSGGGGRAVIGDPMLAVPVESDLTLEVPADAFTQVHAAGNLALVASVLELAGAPSGAVGLDLYCGAGNFAIPLARRGMRVTGVERAPVAVAAARANAARLGVEASFECGAVAAAFERLPVVPLDLVVLDPPRSGAGEVLGPLADRRPARVVYVSCDPATLARDAGRLTQAGYRLRRVRPIDLFPQTYHIETVAEFVLT